jgi:hypothetical protein
MTYYLGAQREYLQEVCQAWLASFVADSIKENKGAIHTSGVQLVLLPRKGLRMEVKIQHRSKSLFNIPNGFEEELQIEQTPNTMIRPSSSWNLNLIKKHVRSLVKVRRVSKTARYIMHHQTTHHTRALSFRERTISQQSTKTFEI